MGTRSTHSCKAATECSIIWGVTQASRCEGMCPCPLSHRTLWNPSGNSFEPCCHKEKWTIRSYIVGLACPTGWSSRSLSRYLCLTVL